MTHVGDGRGDRRVGAAGGRNLRTPSRRPVTRRPRSPARPASAFLASRLVSAGSAFVVRAARLFCYQASLAPLVLSPGRSRRRRRHRRRGDRRAGELDGRGRRPGCDARGRGRARPRRELAPSARAPLGRPLLEQSMVKVWEAPEMRKELPSGEAGGLVRLAWSQRPFTYAFRTG